MKEFYVTTAANMPNGAGHWVVMALDHDQARALAFERIPEGRWSFLYDDLSKVHALDRTCHGTISA